MSRLRVWAPGRSRVEVELEGTTVALAPAGGGWWEVTVDAVAGSRYRYRLDGGPPVPTPRAASQPEGIGGPSALVDHDAFVWHDQDWKGRALASAVLYELHVGTFTAAGTFDAAIERFGHLVDLGVSTLELLPVAEFGGERGWGYDGVDLFAPHHAYGGPDGLKRFVDAAHGAGLAVVVDVVYNHLGPAGNYLGEFGPYFTDRYSTPWGSAINVDGPGSDEVRRLIVDNATMWLEAYHVDGLRLDAVHAIVDQSALHILEELAGAVGAVAAHSGRTRWLIAESDRNDPRLVTPVERGGFGLDAVWSDDFHHALHAVLTAESGGYYVDFGSLGALARALERVYVYGRDFSVFHDRHHGRPVVDLPATRFLAYAQNHDQIGNRARGERLAHLVSPGRAKIAAALTLTGPDVPMLFQGEEWAASSPFLYFTDHHDPGLGEAVSRGRRSEFAPFGWSPEDVPDPQDPETWHRSILDWSELSEGVHAEILAWYRVLIGLRRDRPELHDGRLDHTRVTCSEADRWLRMDRGALSVVVSIAPAEQAVAVPGDSRLVVGSEPEVRLERPGWVLLPPDSVAILAP